MTHDEAKLQGFDLFTLPPTATELIQTVREFHASTGRETVEFEHDIAGFKVLCLGLMPRKGVVAPVLKLKGRK